MQKFARVVELGSFTRTAEDLHISQPALSFAINKLERELQTPLLIRTKRKLELTEAGSLVYGASVQHRLTNENLMTNLVTLGSKRPNIAIGMIDSMAAVLSSNSQSLEYLEAHANLSVVVNNSRHLREAVKSLAIDLAFVVGDSETHSGLDVDPVGVEPFLVVCRLDYLDSVTHELEQGRLTRFVCYDQLSRSYWHINQKMKKLGLTIRPTFFSTSPDVMLRMVLRGNHVAALPYLLVREGLINKKLVALEHRGQVITIDRPISMVKVHGKVLPGALSDFNSQARKALASINKETKSLQN
jgi:DNA-binding transcriptional LysR family regulator